MYTELSESGAKITMPRQGKARIDPGLKAYRTCRQWTGLGEIMGIRQVVDTGCRTDDDDDQRFVTRCYRSYSNDLLSIKYCST